MKQKRLELHTEQVRSISESLELPHIDGAEDALQKCVWSRAKEIYGDQLPDIVKNRLEWEITRIVNHGFASIFVIVQKLVQESADHGYLTMSRGSVGSSLVAFLAGITEVNPLAPHYVCPKCRHSEFFIDGSVGSGFDLPEKICAICGETLLRDGHDIPAETFLGFYGSKTPDICLNFSKEYQPDTLQGASLKLDILDHDVPTMYKYLEEYTGIPVADVPMCDPAVYSLFTSPEALGVTPEEIDCETGTLSLPEVGTEFVREILTATQPKNFSDLMRVSGLFHGTGVLNDNAEDLIKNGICTLREAITARDDVMNDLIRKGLEPKMAFEIADIVRKGQASERLTDEQKNAMRNCGVPEWYIESCMKIRYVFPKAHTAAYMIAAVRLGWYKIYYPAAYYAAHYTVHPDHYEMDPELHGEPECRRICFLPPDPERSHATKFLVEDGSIRLPLSFS